MKKPFKTFLRKADTFEDKVREKAVGYILAGLGVVAGLAWNDAIKALIEAMWPLEQGTLIAKFVYATVLTIFIVLATVILIRVGKTDEKKK